MNRDAYPEFAEAPGLREVIEAVAAERAERAAIDADYPALERLIKWWTLQGKPELTFRLVRHDMPMYLARRGLWR
jgi:hypothetical protein